MVQTSADPWDDSKAGEIPLSCPDLQVTPIEQLKELLTSAQQNYFREIMENKVYFGEHAWAHKQFHYNSWEDKTQARRGGIQNNFAMTRQPRIMAFKIKKLNFLSFHSAFITSLVFYCWIQVLSLNVYPVRTWWGGVVF